jgi:hypothetical protein
MTRHPRTPFVACLVVAASIDFALAAPGPACEITFYGLIAETDADSSATGTSTAAGNMTNGELANFEPEPTPLVPAVLGAHFGVLRKLANIPVGDNVELVISHPPIAMPDGKQQERTVQPAAADSIADAYRFDEPYEVMPGDWAFEYFYQGKRLCRHVFHVIPIEFH